jgi:hypothetical protein
VCEAINDSLIDGMRVFFIGLPQSIEDTLDNLGRTGFHIGSFKALLRALLADENKRNASGSTASA